MRPSSDRRVRPWLTLGAVLAVLGGLLGPATGSAGAAQLSECTAGRGTIVAVDFAHWGGPIVRGCGINQPSGYALLQAAGFTTAGDEYDGPSFICRIGDEAYHDGTQYPTPSEDPCIQTPPASAYWSYWLAPAGQNAWTYSQLGPTGDVPKPGEVELWTFGATTIAGTAGSGVPHVNPSTLRAASATATTRTTTTTRTSTHTTATTHTSRRTTATTHTSTRTTATTHTSTRASTRATATAPTSAHSTATTRTSPHTTATGAAATHPPRAITTSVPRLAARPASTAAALPASTGPGHGAAAGGAAIVSSQPARRRPSSGSAVPLIAGICLVAVVLAGAAWAVWRRREYE